MYNIPHEIVLGLSSVCVSVNDQPSHDLHSVTGMVLDLVIIFFIVFKGLFLLPFLVVLGVTLIPVWAGMCVQSWGTSGTIMCMVLQRCWDFVCVHACVFGLQAVCVCV